MLFHLCDFNDCLKMAEKDRGNKSLEELVDTINQGDTYKVLTKAEFENLDELASSVIKHTKTCCRVGWRKTKK